MFKYQEWWLIGGREVTEKANKNRVVQMKTEDKILQKTYTSSVPTKEEQKGTNQRTRMVGRGGVLRRKSLA